MQNFEQCGYVKPLFEGKRVSLPCIRGALLVEEKTNQDRLLGKDVSDDMRPLGSDCTRSLPTAKQVADGQVQTTRKTLTEYCLVGTARPAGENMFLCRSLLRKAKTCAFFPLIVDFGAPTLVCFIFLQ